MKKIWSGLVAVLASGTSAFAADFYQPEVIEAPVIEQPVAVQASGWYLRGDVGYSFNKIRGARFFQGSNRYQRDFDTVDVDDSFSIGGGVGYQFTDHLRSDLTLDYMFKSDFSGSTSGGGAAVGACVGPCTSRDVSSYSALSLLANAYVDIGTYGVFTPYVGGGIGGTQVNWKNLNNTSCSDTDPTNCDGSVEHDGKKSWRFTYALMAGASIDVTCNLKADVGYRYRRILGGNMFGYKSNGGPGSDKGFHSHEGRLGLRYAFNGCDEAAYIPPADIPLQQPVYK